MAYEAEKTVQITVENEPNSPSLVVHEMGEDGHPICGTGGDGPRPWMGNTMVFTPQGRGTVTCGRCARTVA
jgi:hypothetical protein